MQNQHPLPNLFWSFIPIICLVLLLSFNVYVFGDDAIEGSNQFILLIGGSVAFLVGILFKVPVSSMLAKISDNIKSITSAMLILLFVGSLAASWLISGIIPAMVYYGIQLLSPTYFLPCTVIISALISIATGSSWTTSATIGISLIAIGKTMGFPSGMVAGAVISGAYFGDKLSPLSDTTNLASAIAGSTLFNHIRYMLLTTVPSIVITLLIFTGISLSLEVNQVKGLDSLLLGISESFYISKWLFLVPLLVILMIFRKVSPLVALFLGTVLGVIFTFLFQSAHLSSSYLFNYKYIMDAITSGISIQTENSILNELFRSGGMSGMLGTIWLIICAMVFGGIMESIGALHVISKALLYMSRSIFGLFASTLASCLTINLTASDQYLAIVVPGKMFKQSYEDSGLAPENLSRTLEDSGTVTSVLIPWNTCGAYQSGVLGVGVGEYFIYAIFNYLSPLMSLIVAATGYKVKRIVKPNR